MSPKMAKRVSKKMEKVVAAHADISTEKKHQAAHDKIDAALHKMKMEHIKMRRSKHNPE
jgi:hypothetical protein